MQQQCTAAAWKQWCASPASDGICKSDTPPPDLDLQVFNVRSKESLLRPDGASASWQFSISHAQRYNDPTDLLGNVTVHLEGNILLKSSPRRSQTLETRRQARMDGPIFLLALGAICFLPVRAHAAESVQQRLLRTVQVGAPQDITLEQIRKIADSNDTDYTTAILARSALLALQHDDAKLIPILRAFRRSAGPPGE